jgi:hypothetical protein
MVYWKSVFILGILLALSEPSPPFRMGVKEVIDPAKPTFCFGVDEKCAGEGELLTLIFVMEINDRGEGTQFKWIISHIEGNTSESAMLNQLTYGVVPEAYKEKLPAKPLKLNTYYRTNGDNYFKIYEKSGKYEIEIINESLDKKAFEQTFPDLYLMRMKANKER